MVPITITRYLKASAASRADTRRSARRHSRRSRVYTASAVRRHSAAARCRRSDTYSGNHAVDALDALARGPKLTLISLTSATRRLGKFALMRCHRCRRGFGREPLTSVHLVNSRPRECTRTVSRIAQWPAILSPARAASEKGRYVEAGRGEALMLPMVPRPGYIQEEAGACRGGSIAGPAGRAVCAPQ